MVVSNTCFAARIVSVMMTISEISCNFVAWSNSKKFHFSGVNIHGVMDRFVNNVMTFMNMRDQSSNIVLDACISDDKYCVLIVERIFIDIIKSIVISS